MRFAILSDIHGNVLALEAVLGRLKDLSPDVVLNLGDCVSGPLWPVETVAMLRAQPMEHVRGNHDRIVGTFEKRPPSQIDAFAWDAVSADDRAWLGGLPRRLERDGMLCVHGTLASDLDYLAEDIVQGGLVRADLAVIGRRIGPTEARIVLCGHSHQPRLLRLPGGVSVLNPGSVGWQAYADDDPPHVSETGSPHARFAVLDMTSDRFDVALHAIEYDWEAAARQALANGRPDWAHELTSGLAAPVPASA